MIKNLVLISILLSHFFGITGSSYNRRSPLMPSHFNMQTMTDLIKYIKSSDVNSLVSVICSIKSTDNLDNYLNHSKMNFVLPIALALKTVKEKKDQNKTEELSKAKGIVGILILNKADITVKCSCGLRSDPSSTHGSANVFRYIIDTDCPDLVEYSLRQQPQIDINSLLINDDEYVQKIKRVQRGRFDSILNHAVGQELDPLIIYMLIQHKADVNMVRGMWSPLIIAAGLGNELIVQMLLHYKADKNIRNLYGSDACDVLDPEVLNKKSPNLHDNLYNLLYNDNSSCFQRRLLIGAIFSQDFEKVKGLIDRKAPVNPAYDFYSRKLSDDGTPCDSYSIYSKNKDNPLGLAIYLNNISIVKLLIDSNAEVNNVYVKRKDSGQYSSMLSAAVDTKNAKMVDLLLASKASVNQTTYVDFCGEYEKLERESNYLSHICLAITRGSSDDIIKSLAKAANYIPDSSLELAVAYGSKTDIVTLLLQSKANPYSTYEKRESLLKFIKNSKHKEEIEQIIAYAKMQEDIRRDAEAARRRKEEEDFKKECIIS